VFDITSVLGKRAGTAATAKISKQNSQVLCETNFCRDSDFTVRTFGNYMYAVDGFHGSLHVYSIKDKQWNYSRLDDLGVA